jgi:hypothetical protein
MHEAELDRSDQPAQPQRKGMGNIAGTLIRQVNEPDGERVGLPTVFFPMTRVERISLDEPSGSIPSMAEVFERKIGRSLAEYLAQFA